MPIRRNADPLDVISIWDAIRQANQSHLAADTPRICKYIQSVKECTLPLAELYIRQAVKDNLILLNKKSENGKKTYKVATQEWPELDGKDWYCFECHLAGDVISCSNCFRVFHSGCVKGAKRKFESQKVTNVYPKTSGNIEIVENAAAKSTADLEKKEFDEGMCSMCNINAVDYSCGLDRVEVNYILRFVLHRIRAWLPATITHTMAEMEEKPAWLTDAELTWRANQLFFENMDMSVIEVKLNTESYTQFSEFLADVYTIHHNVAIFHGIESQEYGAAELMMRDALYDLAEMKCCVDCYKHSNEKVNDKWFCLPCREPHQLVWAKQRGYPYWPAKVIKETDTHFDVRFFGGKYERANLLKSFVKDISAPVESLQIKMTSAFKKAREELEYHQLLLSNPFELQQLLANSKPKRRSKQKQVTPVSTPSEPKTVERGVKRATSVEVRDNKKSRAEGEQSSSEEVSGNVINISDNEGDDNQEEYSFRDNMLPRSFSAEETYEQVSSSTENFGKQQFSPRGESGMMPLDHPYDDAVEKMRRQLECLSHKKDIIKFAMDCMQVEIDRINNENNEHLKRLFESHNQQISENKKRQWCYNCEQDAIYHCCWNTAYCSQTCQQQHWQAEHKKVCRRKRN